MIHIATVHWATPRWIDIQLHYLEKHISSPFRVYACLDEIEGDFSDRFFYTCSLDEVRHPAKLNTLGRHIAEEGYDGDLLVFIDGDAFPIAPFEPAVARLLSENPLAAIRRDENLGDPQPHPSFCVTTIAFWQEIKGNWSRGETWLNTEGDVVNEPGGKLLKNLNERGIAWTPILRSNVTDIHPIMFGVYGNLIYHHGAGFRPPLSRSDIAQVARAAELTISQLKGGMEHASPELRKFMDMRETKREENERLSEEVFERIKRDDDFARSLSLI